jgi:hypothetical protein
VGRVWVECFIHPFWGCHKIIISNVLLNEEKSAASLCYQVAAWVPEIFCNFYSVKSHQIAKISTTTKAREKISADLESLE